MPWFFFDFFLPWDLKLKICLKYFLYKKSQKAAIVSRGKISIDNTIFAISFIAFPSIIPVCMVVLFFDEYTYNDKMLWVCAAYLLLLTTCMFWKGNNNLTKSPSSRFEFYLVNVVKSTGIFSNIFVAFSESEYKAAKSRFRFPDSSKYAWPKKLSTQCLN